MCRDRRHECDARGDAARDAGREVLGISLVTNLPAGMSGEPLQHAEVRQTGKAAATRMGDLLGRIVPVSDAGQEA